MRRTTTIWVFGLLIQVAATAAAATVTWTGTTSGDFNTGSNWTGGSAPTGADVAQFNAPSAGGATTVTGNVTFNATTGKIAFGGSAPNYTLGATIGGNTIRFVDATNDAILVSGTATQTINDNIVMGTGSTATSSLTTSNTAGGLLWVKGNVSAGSGAATTGTLTFSLGSASGNNGNYRIDGNISNGGALAVGLAKRGSGTATLTGTNGVVALYNNEANSTIRIDGGVTSITNAAATGWGGSNQQSSVIRVASGTLTAFDSRQVRNSVSVEGGVLSLGPTNTSGSARFSFNNPGSNVPFTFGLSSGSIGYFPSYSTNNFGVRLGNDSGPSVATAGASVTGLQTGGTFTVFGAGGQDSTFSLGTAEPAKDNAYTLSGGLLDIRGSNDANGWLTIGAGTASGTTTFTLNGGKLVVRGSSGSINGRQAGAVQVFSFTGGTLVAGKIDATNLRSTTGGTNGTFEVAGGTLSPGDAGTVGTTSVVGGMKLSSGTYAVDFGTSRDQTLISGGLDIASSAGTPFTIAITSTQAGFSNTARQAVLIATATGGITNYAANKFTFNASAVTASLANGGFVTGTTTTGSATALQAVFIPSAVYDLSAATDAATIITGGSATITAAILNNATGRTQPDSFNYTGLAVGNGVSITNGSGSGIAASGSSVGNGLFTGGTPGVVTFTPTATTVTNATIGTSSLFGSASAATVTVLDHATPGFIGLSGSDTVLNLDFGTVDLSAGPQSLPYALTNLFNATYGANLTAGLALTGFSTDGDGFSSGLTTFGNLAAGGTSSVFAGFTPSTTGSFTRQFSLTFTDQQTLSGATSLRGLVVNMSAIVVPEPATLSAVGMGLVVFLVRWRSGRR